MRPFICSICGKAFDDSTKAKQHVAARTGGCSRRNAEVLRRRVEIRASDRVVGGRERFDDYVSNVNAEPAGDGGSNGDAEPAGDGGSNGDAEPAGDGGSNGDAEPSGDNEPDVHDMNRPPESMRGLIEILRSAVSGDDVVQKFKAITDPTPARPTVAQQDSRSDVGPDSSLNYSQRQILKLRKEYKLNRKASNAVLSLVQDPKFNPSELGTRSVRLLDRALLCGHDEVGVREYDFYREGDGLQDLKMYTLECKRVASELFRDPKFKGHMTFKFTPTFDDEGRRTFGSAMGGVWAQFHASAVVDGVEVILVLAIYIDASFVKINLTVKPVYCT
jgi:hypothetical protein